MMQTPSPWATKADVEAAREELKAEIAVLNANLTAMQGDLRAVKALLTEQNKRRPWWRRLFAAGVVLMAVMAASAGARAEDFANFIMATGCIKHVPAGAGPGPASVQVILSALSML
jgi:hypothetical protein